MFASQEIVPGKAGKKPQQARKQPAYVTPALSGLSEVVIAIIKPMPDRTKDQKMN